MNKIKAIFFDFDMTLVSTKNIAKEIYTAFSKHARLKPTEKGFEDYLGARLSGIFDMFAKDKHDRKKLLKLFLKVHDKKMNQIKVYGKGVLKYLKNKKIKVVIISNTSKRAIKKICGHFNLHFDRVIGDEDMPGSTKKHQAMLRILKKLKLRKEEALYVGDHINDIKEGRKAGIRVVSVTTGVFSKKQLAKYRPFAIIKNLEELKDLI